MIEFELRVWDGDGMGAQFVAIKCAYQESPAVGDFVSQQDNHFIVREGRVTGRAWENGRLIVDVLQRKTQ